MRRVAAIYVVGIKSRFFYAPVKRVSATFIKPDARFGTRV